MAQVIQNKPIAVDAPPVKPAEKVEKVEKVEKAEKAEIEKKQVAHAPAIRKWRRPIDLMRRMFGRDPFESVMPRFWRDEEIYAPEFSVKETKEAFVFKADVPGLEAKDLEISVDRNQLEIRGKREEEKTEEGETTYTYERTFGSFSRAFALPEGVDADEISCNLKDGVLTVIVPKVPGVAAQTRKIEIKTP